MIGNWQLVFFFLSFHIDDLSYSSCVFRELAKAKTIMWQVHQVEFILLTDASVVFYHTHIPKDVWLSASSLLING